MTYFKYCSELRIRNRGEVEHHVIPKSVMKENNFLTVKCTPQEHLWLHILYDRENETITRKFLWNRSLKASELDWRTCSYDDLEGFNDDWELHNLRISQAKKGKYTGEENPNYGKHYHLSKETRQKMSKAHKGESKSEETCRRISETKKGEKNPMYGRTGEKHHLYGKHPSEEAKRRVSEANKATKQLLSQEYKLYKQNGGELKWNEWCKQASSNT